MFNLVLDWFKRSPKNGENHQKMVKHHHKMVKIIIFFNLKIKCIFIFWKNVIFSDQNKPEKYYIFFIFFN
jgi:hypothetical protein